MPLYTLRSDVEAALEKGSNVAVSVDGHHSTAPKDLTTLSRWTMSYWSKCYCMNAIEANAITHVMKFNFHLIPTDLFFPMSASDVYSSIEEVSSDWEVLGVNLNIPTSKFRTIDANFHKVEDKKIELIQTWMTGRNMPSWSILVKALFSPTMNQPIIVENISQHQSKYQYFIILQTHFIIMHNSHSCLACM